MRRGTTPHIKLTIDGVSPDQCKSLYVTLKQGAVELTKEKSDCTFDGDIIIVILTQQETLAFTSDKSVRVQVRGILNSTHDAFATDIVSVEMNDILKDGEIE